MIKAIKYLSAKKKTFFFLLECLTGLQMVYSMTQQVKFTMVFFTSETYASWHRHQCYLFYAHKKSVAFCAPVFMKLTLNSIMCRALISNFTQTGQYIWKVHTDSFMSLSDACFFIVPILTEVKITEKIFVDSSVI
jgi:hypothetical protein